MLTTPVADVAKTYPSEIRLPPYAGTATYRFSTRARLRGLVETGGRLYALAASGDRIVVLALAGRTFALVPLPGGPFASLAVTEAAPSFVVLAGRTIGPAPQRRHLVLSDGIARPTKALGDGSRTAPASGLRCIDARRSSAYDGAALIVTDVATAQLRPSISKAALSPPTRDAASDRSLSLDCHAFGPDALVWLAAPARAGDPGRPAGITLLAGSRLRPLAGVAPVGVTEHYVLFEEGDPAGGAPLDYTLLRTS